MNHSDLCLKPIHELLTDDQGNPTRFWIPAYQRGYRWKPLQVTQLLEDVREFSRRRNPQPEDFYCLQPLVIKATALGQLEVVDGQQRLTTLLLILRHFNERLAQNRGGARQNDEPTTAGLAGRAQRPVRPSH